MKNLVLGVFVFGFSLLSEAKTCQDFVWRITAVLDEKNCSEAFIEGRFEVKLCQQDLSYLQNEFGEKLYIFRNNEGLESRTDHIDFDKDMMISTVFEYDLENQAVIIIRENHDIKKAKLVSSFRCEAKLESL